MNRLQLKQSVRLGACWVPPASLFAPAKFCSDAKHSGVANAKAKAKVVDKAELDLPEVGWMWQTKVGNRESPTAQTTVANLKQDRIRPKKSLGQNFLTDDVILSDIVSAAGVQPGDLVLEIGPGTGNLTKHLLDRGAVVTAIEKDDTLYDRLNEEYKEVSTLRIIKGDCLKLSIPSIVDEMIRWSMKDEDGIPSEQAVQERAKQRPVKVVANLPYNITRDFLKSMLPMGHCVSELHIMIQDEVAVRLVDRTPGRHDYRAMNLLVQYFSNPRYRLKIPKEKYYPAPGVDGALTTFDLIPPEQRVKTPDVQGIFMSTVYKSFLARRKMIKNNLQSEYTLSQIEKALKACELRKDARAQDLNLKQFANLVNHLHQYQSEDNEIEQRELDEQARLATESVRELQS